MPSKQNLVTLHFHQTVVLIWPDLDWAVIARPVGYAWSGTLDQLARGMREVQLLRRANAD